MNLEELTGEQAGSSDYYAKIERKISEFQHSVFRYTEWLPAGIYPGGYAVGGIAALTNPEGAKEFMDIMRSLDLKDGRERDLAKNGLRDPGVIVGIVRSGQESELLEFIASMDDVTDPGGYLANCFIRNVSQFYDKTTRQSATFRTVASCGF